MSTHSVGCCASKRRIVSPEVLSFRAAGHEMHAHVSFKQGALECKLPGTVVKYLASDAQGHGVYVVHEVQG
eukprot:3559387-Pleurochrysis_carterae.AAC.1